MPPGKRVRRADEERVPPKRSWQREPTAATTTEGNKRARPTEDEALSEDQLLTCQLARQAALTRREAAAERQKRDNERKTLQLAIAVSGSASLGCLQAAIEKAHW